MATVALLPIQDVTACCAPLTHAPMDGAGADALAKTLKAIADPARLRIISMVAAGAAAETCACDLQEPLGLSQPTVSHHTKVLVDAGILTREKRGTWAYYSLAPGALESLAALIGGVLS